MAKVETLICLYLALPVVIFLGGWFAWYINVPIIILIIFWFKNDPNCWLPSKNHSSTQWWPLITYHLSLITLSFVWAYLSGVGGFRPQHFDYYKHNLIFNNLVRHDWPVVYADGHYLCYYLAYYLPAAGLAKIWGGLAAVGYYSFVWTWLGLWLLFYQLHKLGGYKLIAFFCFFNSPEAVLLIYETLHSPLTIAKTLADLWSNDHTIELIFTPGGLMFPSHVESITAVPQHAIGGWLAVSLLLNHRRSFFPLLPLCFLLYWSPFVALGSLPFVIFQKKLWKNWQELVIALAIAVPALIYYAGHVPIHDLSGWWWHFLTTPHQYLLLTVFIVIEVGIFVLFFLLTNKNSLKNKHLITSLGILLCLSVYRYGHFNDLARRCSLPATMVLCWHVWQCLKIGKSKHYATIMGLFICAILPLKHHLKWLTPTPYTAQVNLSIEDMNDHDIYFLENYHKGEFDVVAQYLGKRQSLYYRIK